jgi:hypothetical protein
MLETEANEDNKEDNPWILVLAILVSMKEQICPGVSGLLRSLGFLLLIVFLRCSIPHRPNILLEEPVRSAILTQSFYALAARLVEIGRLGDFPQDRRSSGRSWRNYKREDELKSQPSTMRARPSTGLPI